MDKRQKHIKILLTLLLAAIAVLAPVVHDQHVCFHHNMDVDGHAISEHCAICSLEFPAFEKSDPTPIITEIEQTAAYYVPSIIGNLCSEQTLSSVIRGPPMA